MILSEHGPCFSFWEMAQHSQSHQAGSIGGWTGTGSTRATCCLFLSVPSSLLPKALLANTGPAPSQVPGLMGKMDTAQECHSRCDRDWTYQELGEVACPTPAPAHPKMTKEVRVGIGREKAMPKPSLLSDISPCPEDALDLEVGVVGCGGDNHREGRGAAHWSGSLSVP